MPLDAFFTNMFLLLLFYLLEEKFDFKKQANFITHRNLFKNLNIYLPFIT